MLRVLCVLYSVSALFFSFFFFTDTATTQIYTLSLHDALPIFLGLVGRDLRRPLGVPLQPAQQLGHGRPLVELFSSEEHTSELQSLRHLVCRLLLEKKKTKNIQNST